MSEAPVNVRGNYNRVKVGNCFNKIWLYAGKSGVSGATLL